MSGRARSRRLVVVVAATFAVLVLVGLLLTSVRSKGGDASSPSAARSSGASPRAEAGGQATVSPSTAPTLPEATSSPTAAPAADDLESRLLQPDGFTRVSDIDSGLGELRLEDVAPGASGADARAGLKRLGFQSARAHLYRGSGAQRDLLVSITGYRLSTRNGADKLLAQSRSAAKGEPFRSATVPGAYTYDSTAGRYAAQKGLLARSSFVYEVSVLSTSPSSDHTLFDRLMQQQRDLAVQSDPAGSVR